MQDIDGAIAKMHDLTEPGITLSLDNFGTGYSSLSSLKKFPLARLKIDRSFIENIPTDDDDMAIVTTIVALAKVMELEVVARASKPGSNRISSRVLDVTHFKDICSQSLSLRRPSRD